MNLYILIKTLYFEWKEERQVRARFYTDREFKAKDKALLALYQRRSPYHISKTYLRERGVKEVYAYGETPLTTMETIANECELKAGDLVIEMGAGRGRTSLFLAEKMGCRVIGYEQVLEFVKNFPSSKRASLVGKDMFAADFSGADAIYLYGTMLEDTEIKALTKQFLKGIKIITVSYPLSDYSDQYKTVKVFPGIFPWGVTEVYWNERTC